jgi:phosphatidylinositol phospholipase C, delta
VDLWDGPGGEPVIYHGLTLTSKISAREALVAIAKYAFVASPYPVILSLEVHCDTAQQTRLAAIVREILGSALVDKPIKDEEELRFLPSPEELKWRILIKVSL